MNQQTSQALKILGIKPKAYGAYFRVKTVNETGRIVYKSKIVSEADKTRLATFYKKKLSDIEAAFDDINHRMTYKPFYGKDMETHLYEHCTEAFFYKRAREILVNHLARGESFKVNIWLAYDLIDRIEQTERYFSSQWNTSIFTKSMLAPINQSADIDNRVFNFIRGSYRQEQLRIYKNSREQVKSISGFKLLIYYRAHKIGENVELPLTIKNNKNIVDFPNTKDKCVLYCVAYHLEKEEPRPKRMGSYVKTAAKRWCAFKKIEYSHSLFLNMKPIDIAEFGDVERCFEININAFESDIDGEGVSKIRTSTSGYDSTLNILIYKRHAMYVKSVESILSKYYCTKCDMIFSDNKKCSITSGTNAKSRHLRDL